MARFKINSKRVMGFSIWKIQDVISGEVVAVSNSHYKATIVQSALSTSEFAEDQSTWKPKSNKTIKI